MRATQPGQSFFLLLDIVDILNARRIDYAVIGALAASFHGVVRASLDADALLSLTTETLKSLASRIKKDGFKTDLRRGNADDPISAVLAVSDTHGNKVDLLVGIRGFDPVAFSRTVDAKFEAGKLRVVGLEDFIAMKVFAGSPQDLSDAKRALAVSGKSLNRSLLEQLTTRYGKKYLKCLKSIEDRA